MQPSCGWARGARLAPAGCNYYPKRRWGPLLCLPAAQVSWDLIPCANLTSGTIKMLLKKGGQAYYQAFG